MIFSSWTPCWASSPRASSSYDILEGSHSTHQTAGALSPRWPRWATRSAPSIAKPERLSNASGRPGHCSHPRPRL